MQRYWITIAADEPHGGATSLGIGVTARSEDDARSMVLARFGEVRIVGVRVIDDMATVDQGRVAPNMGNHFMRGIWFPRDS